MVFERIDLVINFARRMGSIYLMEYCFQSKLLIEYLCSSINGPRTYRFYCAIAVNGIVPN